MVLALITLTVILVGVPALVDLTRAGFRGSEVQRFDWDLQRITGAFDAYVDRYPASRYSQLEGVNPMNYVSLDLPRYAGELGQGDRREPGRWYFDRSLGRLIYRVESGDHIRSQGAAPAEIHFRVSASGLGPEINDFRQRARDRGSRPVLRPVHRYTVRRD